MRVLHLLAAGVCSAMLASCVSAAEGTAGLRMVSSSVRQCGDAPANYPRAGVYNITARVVRCSVAQPSSCKPRVWTASRKLSTL